MLVLTVVLHVVPFFVVFFCLKFFIENDRVDLFWLVYLLISA